MAAARGYPKRSQKDRQISDDITYTWSLEYGTNEPVYKKETVSGTRRASWWLPTREGRGEGWRGRLGLADVGCYTENGSTAGFYCIAHGTMLSAL